MTDKKDQPEGLEDLFDEAEIISVYTDQQAVEDGILFDVIELRKLSPSIPWGQGPFQYVTNTLCSKGYIKDDVPSVPNFLDLFRTMTEYMKHSGQDHFYTTTVEFPDGTTGEVYAVQNASGRYTLMRPEDY